MKKLLFLMMTCFIYTTFIQAQEDTASVTYVPSLGIYLLEYTVEGIAYIDTLIPATKIDPVVNCDVTFDNWENLYTYSYTLSLLPSSKQYLLSFQLFYSANIQQKIKPSNRWQIFDFLGQNNIDWSNTNIDPSGLHTDTTDIGPGSSMSGFSYRTSGLPVIVNSYFEGNPPGLAFTGEPPTKMSDLLDPIVVFPNNTVIRRTLGPKDPPAPFVPLVFLDTLISMKNEAKSKPLQWIKKSDLSNLIDERLDRARDLLLDGAVADARAELQEILNGVLYDCTAVPPISYLTSEACALLQYNLEYLIKQLAE